MILSQTSMQKLATCEEELQDIVLEVARRTEIGFGISEGHRALEKQQEYFKAGLSKIDGITKKGKHNYLPSKAFDFFALKNGKACYDAMYMKAIANLIKKVAKEKGVKIAWGGDWKKFVDMPHIELC